MTRVLIFGGREFDDVAAVERTLTPLHRLFHFSAVIEGEAVGADTLARDWAQLNGIPVEPHFANWDLFGARAGTIRNARMLREGNPKLGIGFPGGPGTADMARRLKAADVPIIQGTWSAGPGSAIKWKVVRKNK